MTNTHICAEIKYVRFHYKDKLQCQYPILCWFGKTVFIIFHAAHSIEGKIEILDPKHRQRVRQERIK